ncbi:MAG: BatA domain-containing protein [Candidatus Nanohaloarchaea archaeon]
MAPGIAFLNQYFLSPPGLLAALGIIPLIVFYLIKPKPEEQVMPSLTFFMKDKRSGKVSQAFHKIMRNLLILFHILMILGFAAAIAQPFIEAREEPENAVIVFDRSASMSDDYSQAKKFVNSNLAEENTLVTAGEEVSVPLEKASGSQVRRKMNSLKPQDTRTDIAAALELAADQEGTIIVASDLDQTVNSRSPGEIIQNLRNEDRNIRIMETGNENSWGIVGVNPGEKNSSIDIKNFQEKKAGIEVRVGDGARTVNVGAGEVRTVKIATGAGRNTVILEEDEMVADNKAYISIPGEKNFQAVLVTDTGNRYIKTALELMEFIDVRVVNPPVRGSLNGDVYIIGETDRLLKGTVDKIEKDVREGKSMVVFGQYGIFNKGFKSLPVEPGKAANASVEIEKPVRVNVGQTRVFKVKKTGGESLSEPDNAVIKSDYGRGEVVFYNIDNRDFRTEFLYPVFWKRLLEDLTGQPDIEQLNRRTGTSLNESSIQTPSGETVSGRTELDQAGFYNATSGTYAANLLSADESDTETAPSVRDAESSKSRKNIQNFAALLLAGLALLELFYLIYTGDA